MERDYFDVKNDIFFEFLDELFQIKKAKRWEDIARQVTLEKIKRTYKTFASLYPRNIDYQLELEKTKSSFSSIHYGTLKGNTIIDEVVRFSLYSDKIIVFHPLQNPATTSQKMDPRKDTRTWLPDFLEALYFYIVIQKWVRYGVIKIIVNPYEYDFDLRDKFDKLAYSRLEKMDQDEALELGRNKIEDTLAESFAQIYKYKSKEYIKNELLKMQQPRFTENEAEVFSERIVTSFEKVNPLYNKLNIPIPKHTYVSSKGGGGPLESILLIADKTGGNIYTPSEINWYQIKKMGVDDFWTKTNKLYSNIPLTFLNNVDTNFALELRKENRLSGVRTQLKKIYSEVNNISVENFSEVKMRDLQEEFVDELRRAENEWINIKKQADISRKQWILANSAIPYINNEITFLPLIASSLGWLYYNEKVNKQNIIMHKINNPISVFVDLKNQRQGFFSELKNCIF